MSSRSILGRGKHPNGITNLRRVACIVNEYPGTCTVRDGVSEIGVWALPARFQNLEMDSAIRPPSISDPDFTRNLFISNRMRAALRGHRGGGRAGGGRTGAHSVGHSGGHRRPRRNMYSTTPHYPTELGPISTPTQQLTTFHLHCMST